MKYRLCSIIFVGLLAASGASGAQTKPESDKIRIGYAARAVAHSVPYVAKEAGFFAEEGFSRYASMVFVNRPEVRSPQDLKGKVIGIQRPGDAYEKSARFALRHLGLDADRDVKMLALGTNDVMWTALHTGKVSATILSPPGTLFARKAGMNFMVDLNDLKLEYQGSTLATRRSFVQNNPGVATRALRAIVRGVFLFKTRKEETMRILAKFLGTKNREALEESWDYAAKMPAKPYAVESAVQAVLDHLAESQPRFAQYRPGQFIDARILSDIDKSGYIDRLYDAAKPR